MRETASRPPRVGDAAPDFVLPATDGGVVRLRDEPKPLAVSFLRHLA